MIEICLIIYFIYILHFTKPKGRVAKRFKFSSDSIRLEELQSNVKEAEKQYFKSIEKACSDILEKIQDKTVIQIQMYGLEWFYRRDFSGVYQMAVAKRLRKELKTDLILQDMDWADRYPSEIEFFKQEKIEYRSKQRNPLIGYREAIANSDVDNPLILCYFDRFQSYSCYTFYGVPWDSNIFEHILFVTHDNTPAAYSGPLYEKIKATRWCSVKPLIIEWPRLRELGHSFPPKDSIMIKEVQEAVAEAKNVCFHSKLLVYTQIMSLLRERTVVQVQMYGLGSLWRKKENGSLQLQVALAFCEKFKAQFPELSMTSQDPLMSSAAAEKEYLKSLGIKVYEGDAFCSSRIFNPKTVKAPVIIVYSIHFWCEKFFEAHWDAEMLSRIILITNEWTSPYDIGIGKKTWNYSRLCESKPLFEDEGPHCVTDAEIRNYCAFCWTNVYSISYENAKHLIDICP